MAINFPTNAQSQLNLGDTYSDATSGITWIWDTVSWKAQGVSPSGLVSNIQDLANVTFSNLQDDQVLTYTAALGWHNESAQGSSGTGVPSIQDITGTAIAVPAGEARELNITGHNAYALFKIEVSHDAWVRLYCDDTSRDNDINRSEGNDPSPGSGLLAEVRTTTTGQVVVLTPSVLGFNNDSPRTNTIYASVTNRTSSAQNIQVKLTLVEIGDN
tara:strand:- start:2857 stop:3501 length:645 start_codon:yes stop_codon:yes gene_type:complete